MIKTFDVARYRLPALAAALIASTLAAASTQPNPVRSHNAHRRHRHVLAHTPALQPVEPAQRQADATAPAPVPNEAVTPPIDHATPSANVGPQVFQLHYPPQGEGYVTGSSPQAMDDRNAAKVTGVQATVPLPQ